MTNANPHIRWLPLVALAALAGCDTTNPPVVSGEAALRRMASCDDLRDRLEEVVLESMVDGTYGVYRGGLAVDDAAEDGADAPSGDADGGGDAPSDFTTTNVQEEGVDELDIVKMNADGTVMFVAQDRALQIVKSWPAEDAALLASVPLDGWARGLFVVGDHAVVTSSVPLYSYYDGREGPDGKSEAEAEAELWGSYDLTRLTIVDVSDPSNPEVERVIDTTGYVADARMIDGEIYTVLNQYMDLPYEIWDLVWTDEVQARMPEVQDWEDEDEIAAAQAEARRILAPRVAAAFDTLDAAELLPRWRLHAGDDITTMYACDDLYAPQQVSPLAMLSVMRLDPDSGTVDTTGLLSQGWTIYASKDNLYVAQTSAWWWGWDDAPVSHIHKFALAAGAEPLYVASGQVAGWMYDQFAMSEFDGYLRAVTTDFGAWWFEPDEDAEPPANNVFVLEDDGQGTLEQVGHLGGIAPNEQVRAVRMMGEKGYVVTFEQIDPLFTIDLSDPTDPRQVGELELPGFSAYLHPVGQDHLLGVGMQGLETGELTGLKIDLYDVSDMANPTLLHQLDLSPAVDGQTGWAWSWSEALWDHHAFTYHRDTLTIPTMMEHYDDMSGRWEGFSGTISMHATPEDGISELGRVDHSGLVDGSQCLYDLWYDWEDACTWDYGYWYARVRRSVYIEDNLFTISDYGVRVNELDDPSVPVAEVRFYPE